MRLSCDRSINRHLQEANEQLRVLQATTPKPVAKDQKGVTTYVVKRGSITQGKAETVEKAKCAHCCAVLAVTGGCHWCRAYARACLRGSGALTKVLRVLCGVLFCLGGGAGTRRSVWVTWTPKQCRSTSISCDASTSWTASYGALG